MSELQGKGGELRATIQITRAATGKVETFELVGRTTPEQHAKIVHGASGGLIGPGSAASNEIQQKEES